MPIVELKLACQLAESAVPPVLASLARAVARILDKPADDVMVLCTSAQVHMAGSSAPAALVTVRCVSGLTAEAGQAICEAVRMTLQSAIQIDESRVYLDLSHIDPYAAWRFKGGDSTCASPNFKRESAMAEWSVRTLLNPVMTRLLIAGVNPIDLERIMTKVESTKLLHSRQLEQTWLGCWEERASHYSALAERALQRGHRTTARQALLQAANCYLACFLINFASLDEKARVYRRYAELYACAGELFAEPVRKVELPLPDGRGVPAMLHLPDKGSGVLGSTVVYSGLGSCKEEMHHLARYLAERGVAALVPDMPGSGESLFTHDIACRREAHNAVFAAAVDFLAGRDDVGEAVGCCGLCMGGGYAYRAAARERRYQFCVGLFPLFIADCDENTTPQWMRSGAWFEKQTGGLDASAFVAEMRLGDDEVVRCPYFLVHGRHDNWMTLDKALALYERVDHAAKEKLIIDEAPVFSSEEVFTHTMPVGEQLHWVGPVMADWIVERLRGA